MKVKSIIIIVFVLLISACGGKQPLGSKQNPVKMYFVPSMEAAKIVTSAEYIANRLEEKTGYNFKIAVPTSYAAVIEAMGTEEADIAFLATFAYILANEKYNAQVELMTVRNGLNKYRGQFVALKDSEINSIEDIEDKTIAYTDAASTSGYIYPSALLKQEEIMPSREIMAGGHPQAIMAVYQGLADVGCSFWSPPDSLGIPQDARMYISETYPDVFEKTKIIGYTEWIPNDTVTFRDKFPIEMKNQILNALLEISEEPEGKKQLDELYSINGFSKASDEDYDIVRKSLESLGMDPTDFFK
ncbi:MAG: phosphate/phosphite/phosphonate ABC transporter substrate-binding protein [Candidatus Cloacimonetes bacterium]|jgi:phosphonate transport system substrate-binding protein|nr:phosphate/phosphite/phosphonate ABC transporter substrate-binding protein [Candidatus Cloacimonadota bacterium]MDD4155635.1 phosphate/phosphite/phosphonate ABC transporter substrate-binding protein [Candidatus Cloacimonadota bacterium]